MAGRYPGELFVRVAGDERAARALLPAARLVMGEALEAASAAGLGTYTLRRRLQDGSVIVAEKIGDLKRVTITAGSETSEINVEPGGGFILWPRWDYTDNQPASGTMVDPAKEQPNGWLEFAGRAKVTRYFERWDVVDDIKGARYEPFGTPELYPNGLCFYGNVDWKDGKDWQLSFYGYHSRYYRDVVIPDELAQYVFAQGQVLFARDQYVQQLNEPPEWDGWRINSACMRVNSASGDTELVVAFTDYLTDRATTAQSMFVAFRLLLNDGAPPKGDWRVVVGSHYTLGLTPGTVNPVQPSSANNFVYADSPWFFNASGTAAIRTVNSEPTDAGGSSVNTVTQLVDIDATSIEHTIELQPYLIGNYINTDANFALVAPTRSIVASDFVGDERVDLYLNFKVSQGAYFSGPFAGTLQVNVTLELPSGGEIVLMDRSFAAGADKLSYYQPCYMDLRHDLYAGWHVIGENGAHWIEPFAYMAGNVQVGLRELIGWDPGSGTGQPFLGLDTRVDEISGGIVYTNAYTGASSPGWGPTNRGQGGILWRRHARQALQYFGVTTAVVSSMQARSGMYDFAFFPWIGGWNFNKGRYCVSMPGPYGKSLNYVTGGNMAELLGITADEPRFWPLTALPKAI